jgi:serine/threonine-protein kinase
MEHYEKRFTIEARAAGGLNHPNIVIIYDIGRSGDLAYMAMEYLEGRELKELITGNEITPERALDIAALVADGLAYAHAHEVVHRDVKPANIMILKDSRVKITDFGIARMRTADVRTQTGVVLGSPRYLSPEQVLGKRCDARADTFSLGVILYEMVTGQAPFNGMDVNSLMFQIVNFTPPPPSSINPALPAMLDLIIAKALAKNAEDRYAGIAELAADLRACRQQGVAASPTTVTAAITAPRMIPDPTDPFADTLPSSRADDSTLPDGGVADTLPARGLAKGFDSMAATMRLAAQTGAVTDPDALAATFGVSRHDIDTMVIASDTLPPQEPPVQPQLVPGWSPRDRQIFLVSVAAATVIGALILIL